MWKGRTLVLVPVLIGAALFSLYCTDAAGPQRQKPRPLAETATAGSGIQLDQWNGTIGNQADPTVIVKGFNPTNPHLGDAIVATFFWFGTPGGVTGNIIDSVTDVLTSAPFTPVGNTYELVEFTTHGSVSMATYVATNVQGFPDAGQDPTQILAVRANLKVPVPDGGVLLSAWTGVAGVFEQAIGEHRSASGVGTPQLLGGPTDAAPGAISLNPGALAYGISLSSPPAGLVGPAGWTPIVTLSDPTMKNDGEYNAQFTLSESGGSVDPHWSWFFDATGSWLASVLALNPAPAAPTTGSLTVTTSTSGENPPTSLIVTLDGGTGQTIPANGGITFTDLQPGSHQVTLSGVPDNCEVTGQNPVTVTVVAGETAMVAFTVTCSAPPPPPPPPPPPDDEMTGGGKLQNGREFSTFGLHADASGGKFEWNQHCPDGQKPASTRCARGKFTFKGTVTPGSYTEGSRGPECRTWTGTGTSKETGAQNFTVQACDEGEPGRGHDYIEVTIDDYQNSGLLTGGNIQLHRRKS